MSQGATQSRRSKTAGNGSEERIERGCRLLDEAVALRQRGELGRSQKLGRQALAALEAACGPNHPDVANVLGHLGGVRVDAGDYAGAEPFFRRAVAIMRGNAEENAEGRMKNAEREGDQDLARLRVQSLGNLGSLHRLQGRYREAGALLGEAVLVAEKSLPSADLDLVSALNNLGVVYKYQHRFAEAERLYRRAMTLLTELGNKSSGRRCYRHAAPDGAGRSARSGESSGLTTPASDSVSLPLGSSTLLISHLATLCHNMGGLEHERGRFAKGEPYARRSVALREQVLGPGHVEVAADVAALAALVDGQGKDDEAEALYHRAMGIFQGALGRDHYEVGVNCHNLAALQQRKGNFAKAEQLYRRALAIKEKALGKANPDVALTLNNLGALYKVQERFGEAEPLYRRAWGIFERGFGPGHAQTRLCRRKLEALRGKQKAESRNRKGNHG